MLIHSVSGLIDDAARTIGDLDILVSVKRGPDIMAHFVNYDDVDHVIFKKNIKGHI